MSEGRIIEGRFGSKVSAPAAPTESAAPASFHALVDALGRLPHDGKGNPVGDPTQITRWVAATAARGWTPDGRTKCSDCGAPATREDGLCSTCRRQRGAL